jgi:hypothetical protein
MDLEQAKDEFAVRYYQWAMEDFSREMREGLPLLRKIKGSASLRLVTLMESLGQDEQLLLSSGLVKRFHRRATELLNEPLTAEEDRLCQDYASSIVTPVPAEGETERRIRAGIARRVNRDRLAALSKKELEPILGNPSDVWRPREWWYETPIDGWNVRTNVHTYGGYSYQLNYHHRIHPSGSVYELENWISVLSWLGITSMTNWDLLTDQDMSQAARTLALVCSHFIQAAPSLLEGIV